MKTITKFAAGALLALSVAAPAFAYNPESQLLVERSMSAVGQDQAYNAHAQAIVGTTMTIAPEAQLLSERGANEAFNARAQVGSWAGTRR